MVFQFRNWKVKGRIVLVQTKLIYYSLSVFSLWQSMDLCLVWGVMLFSAQNGMVGSVTAFLKKHRSDPSVYLKILIMIEAWYVEVFVTPQAGPSLCGTIKSTLSQCWDFLHPRPSLNYIFRYFIYDSSWRSGVEGVHLWSPGCWGIHPLWSLEDWAVCQCLGQRCWGLSSVQD